MTGKARDLAQSLTFPISLIFVSIVSERCSEISHFRISSSVLQDR